MEVDGVCSKRKSTPRIPNDAISLGSSGTYPRTLVPSYLILRELPIYLAVVLYTLRYHITLYSSL